MFIDKNLLIVSSGVQVSGLNDTELRTKSDISLIKTLADGLLKDRMLYNRFLDKIFG